MTTKAQATVAQFILAYEVYCGELKAQFEEMKLENEKLKRIAESHSRPALDLLSAMTSLSVCCTCNSGAIRRYSCNIMDGSLKG